jgi:hypothetical protein
MSAKVESELARHASKHIEAPHIDDALGHYAGYLQNLSPKQRASLGPKQHDDYFRTYTEVNPHTARPKPKPPRTW